MAPSDDREPDRCTCSARPTDASPFLALQRFAEEQMSAMLQSLVGLPSAVTAHAPHAWPTDDPLLPDHYRRRIADACAQAAAEHPPSQPSLAAADRPARFPLAASPFSTLWLARYLRDSPYAPPALAADPRLAPHGPRWRRAFEDLLAAESGRPLGDYAGCDADARAPTPRAAGERCVARWDRRWDENMKPQRWGPFRWLQYVEPGSDEDGARAETSEQERDADAKGARDGADDTVTDLLRRMPYPILESPRVVDEPRPDARADAHATAQLATELDAYERMLGRDAAADAAAPSTRTSTSTTMSSLSAHPPHDADGQPGVVATLTSTQRVTLPDGTVRTTRVRRRRFADGREEEDESESVGPSGCDEGHERHAPALRPDGERRGGVLEALRREGMAPTGAKRDGDERKKGWFWS